MNKEVKKISTVSILSALGMVLMLIEIPFFMAGLNFDISDLVVLVAFMMFGWKEALTVGVLKALIHALLKPAFGPLYIGELTAFIASAVLVLGMWLSINKFKFNNIITAIFSVALVTIILTFLNYIFITPMWAVYLTSWTPSFATFLDVKDINVAELMGVNANFSYLAAILAIFIPFNIVKGTILFLLYFAIEKSIKAYLAYNNQ